MVYRLVKWWVTVAHQLYFRKAYWRPDLATLAANGKGKLFAANHPNSFIDPLSLAIYLPYPVHFLVRGDALRGPVGKFLMNYLNLMPVWREKEGRDNLKSNYDTFEACLNIWGQGGAVIIFSEGLCVNEWKLRPLPKGTARLAQSAWERGVALDIIPTSFNYADFRGPGKYMTMTTSAPVAYGNIFTNEPQAAIAQKQFNGELKAALEAEVWQAQNEIEAAELLPKPIAHSSFRKGLRLLTLALHGIYYWPIRRFIDRKTAGTVHYDAALFGVLMLTYPLFLLLIYLILSFSGVNNTLLWLLLWPVTAWLYARS